jgi:hypothetical protein
MKRIVPATYCLRFIKEVVPVWWLVVLSAITVYGLSKKWFSFGD